MTVYCVLLGLAVVSLGLGFALHAGEQRRENADLRAEVETLKEQNGNLEARCDGLLMVCGELAAAIGHVESITPAPMFLPSPLGGDGANTVGWPD
jgi:hypothetical protein